MKNNIIVIPRHLVTVRFVDIPSLDEAEIAKMVEFQALKEIPYSRDEMVIGYRNIGAFKEGFSSIMLVIVKREMIEEKMQESLKRGTKVESVRLYSELLYLFLLRKDIIAKDKVNLIIHIGRDFSELMVVDKTRPIFSRGLENSDKFLEEIELSLIVYERDKDKPKIENVIVVYASGKDIEGIKQYIQTHFEVGVDFHGYTEDLTLLDLPVKIELLPREIREKKVKLQETKEHLLTYILIGFTIILFSAFLYFKFYEKNKILKILSSKVTEIQSKTISIDKFNQKTEISKQYKQKGAIIIEILSASYSIIPDNITLSGLDYDGKKMISYRGICKDTPAVFSFVKVLEKQEFFDKVEVKYATKKKIKGEEFTDFNIRCQMRTSLMERSEHK